MKSLIFLLLIVSSLFSAQTSTKYSEEFLVKNVLPGLKNESLRDYFLNCYQNLNYNSSHPKNNGWIITKECDMFNYPLKLKSGKVLKIGSVNKDKVEILKAQIKKIEKEGLKEQTKPEKIKEEVNVANIEIPEIGKSKRIDSPKKELEIDSKVTKDVKIMIVENKLYLILGIVVIIVLVLIFKNKPSKEEKVKKVNTKNNIITEEENIIIKEEKEEEISENIRKYTKDFNISYKKERLQND